MITDIDSINPTDNNKKCQPELEKGLQSNNDTLKSWQSCDSLLSLSSDNKVKTDLPIRAAYQKANESKDKSVLYLNGCYLACSL